MKSFPRKLFASVVVAAMAGAVMANVIAESAVKPLAESDSRPALAVNHAEHATILDLAQAGKRLVAVGERGLVLWSDDSGQHWNQASVPVSVTLTSVTFATPQQGWAAGHYGLVLHTTDGGQSWSVQLDGSQAAQKVLQQAEVDITADENRTTKRALSSAKRLVADGPDKPFLDIWFANPNDGLVVGAYGLIFSTSDGGQHWQPINRQLDNPGERHLYSIAAANGTVFLAGEEGLVFRSTASQPWQFERLSTPYEGSYFTLSAHGNQLLAAGLRGNAFVSEDQGEHWTELQLPSQASIVDSDITADGRLLLINQAGQLISSASNGQKLHMLASEPGLAPTSLLSINRNILLISGLQGLTEIAITNDQISSN
ncbi:WD40/YVTN/BNR-like repeat-containing protein [Oceanobacter mangrovi]|uniref:WD40/YVTN/BNR-like repeat-containing protein n=1 Tax=Oceanobacter mangrovi TaxID=2862510 RepID=UPI001C8DE7FA|nr:YCF48-related protein [Oceanobacter mangrovi]